MMKRNYILLLLAFSLFSCDKKVSGEDLAKLNGYWEIETVELPDGTEKEYTINSTIDYFELKGKEGIRKKVMPQVDGSYRANGLSENITVTEEGGVSYISYKTEYASWKEEIVTLDDDELILKNEQDIEYHYKKPENTFSVK